MNRDVLIIGGGVIGLSIARELHKQGVRRITLVEKGRCGEESSWAAAGMLGPQAEADERDLFFEFCCEARDLYPGIASELFDETGIDIELDRTGTLYVAFTNEDAQRLLSRYRWQRDAGLPIELLSQEEVIKLESYISAPVQFGLFFPNDWQVENRKLCSALKKYADLNGILILESTRVERLIVEDGRVTGAQSGDRTFSADTTVLATGAWTSLIQLGLLAMPLKVEPVRGQMICLRPERRFIDHVIYSRRGYLVPRADGRVLAGSTSENVGFEKTSTDEATMGLQNMAAEISPFFGGLPVTDRWSGLRPFAMDGMPILGEIAEYRDLFVATAHYRNGILLAPLTGKLIALKLAGITESEHLRIFSPERFRSVGIGSIS